MNFQIDTTLHDPAHFEALFTSSNDPWGFRTRWYEARKRSLTLACLPHQRYASGFEPGCANGELSAVLAERCDHLLVCDGAAGRSGPGRLKSPASRTGRPSPPLKPRPAAAHRGSPTTNRA